MTPERLRECRAILRWSIGDTADATGYDARQVRRWEAGASVPAPVAAWLDLLARFHADNPAPARRDGRMRAA